jgi:uncharacterized protein (TIGR00730 family)
MNICVFCGSNAGNNPIYSEAAVAMGQVLAQNECTLIYGGGNVGIMGVLADEVMHLGGKVVGIIPHFLVQREVGHSGITRLEIVKSMHDRKKRMADLADAFIAMPGGWGTLDELAEILTWRQLGLIDAPIGLLNTNSFFDPLILLMETMAKEGFLSRGSLSHLQVSKTPLQLLTLLGVVAV